MTLRADSLEKLPKTLLAKFLKGGKIGIFIKYIKTTWNFSTVFFHYLKLKLNNVQILKKKVHRKIPTGKERFRPFYLLFLVK